MRLKYCLRMRCYLKGLAKRHPNCKLCGCRRCLNYGKSNIIELKHRYTCKTHKIRKCFKRYQEQSSQSHTSPLKTYALVIAYNEKVHKLVATGSLPFIQAHYRPLLQYPYRYIYAQIYQVGGQVKETPSERYVKGPGRPRTA